MKNKSQKVGKVTKNTSEKNSYDTSVSNSSINSDGRHSFIFTKVYKNSYLGKFAEIQNIILQNY